MIKPSRVEHERALFQEVFEAFILAGANVHPIICSAEGKESIFCFSALNNMEFMTIAVFSVAQSDLPQHAIMKLLEERGAQSRKWKDERLDEGPPEPSGMLLGQPARKTARNSTEMLLKPGLTVSHKEGSPKNSSEYLSTRFNCSG